MHISSACTQLLPAYVSLNKHVTPCHLHHNRHLQQQWQRQVVTTRGIQTSAKGHQEATQQLTTNAGLGALLSGSGVLRDMCT